MKNVKISRKRWCRGGGGNSALRNKTGQSCCLGFVARACGVRTPTNSNVFSDLPMKDWDLLPEPLRPTPNDWGGKVNTELHRELVSVNDDDDVKGRAREERIRDLLAQAGVRVTFVD